MRRSIPGQILKKETKNKRRSIPGGRNLKNEKPAQGQTGQITTCQPRHFNRPMAYGKSPISGKQSGGFYWNPPANCDKRVVYDPENGERWIDINICRACERHKKNDCEAHNVMCNYEVMQ